VILALTFGLYHVDFERYGSVIPNRYVAIQSDDNIDRTVTGCLNSHTTPPITLLSL